MERLHEEGFTLLQHRTDRIVISVMGSAAVVPGGEPTEPPPFTRSSRIREPTGLLAAGMAALASWATEVGGPEETSDDPKPLRDPEAPPFMWSVALVVTSRPLAAMSPASKNEVLETCFWILGLHEFRVSDEAYDIATGDK